MDSSVLTRKYISFFLLLVACVYSLSVKVMVTRHKIDSFMNMFVKHM